MLSARDSDNNGVERSIGSFIESRPPLITNPFMRPNLRKGTNLDFSQDLEYEEPELLQVYLRLKPCKYPTNLYEVRSDRCLITSLDTTTAGHGRRTQHNVPKMYTFSHIFGQDSDQKQIFDEVVKENLKKLPDGNSFTLLTYGASGSGKTFTLMGTVTAPGLVPRSLEYVFKVVDAAQEPLFKPDERGGERLSYAEQEYELQWVKQLRQMSGPARKKYRRMSVQLNSDVTISQTDLSNRRKHYVWVSFIEIYNEGIYDLLALGDRRTATKLAIREDSSGNVYVKGATQAFVRSGVEAYDVMVAGKHHLQVAATGIHENSSRSHCIFTITMLTNTEEGVRTACVRLCDLAGARMHESRAINTSLHVLERCLRALRRRRATAHQPARPPYRESKLTRLLGAGLSGARGEPVSMVVTINPSPEYAGETRHVLQLATVARDIQINNTIFEGLSSLESSTQSTTIGYNCDEVMKLRADNERLHFELIQAEARNRELLTCMDEKQASDASLMREVVAEAKLMTQQYYEAQIEALRKEIVEMEEDYESRLKEASIVSHGNAPSKTTQKQIDELMTEIAILEEKLSAEKLARERAEEEIQRLLACIEERDEKAGENTPQNEDVISLSDSENSDGEDDPCNESLEPTIKIADINRSRMIRQSLIADHMSSILEKSSDTLKDYDKTSSDDDSEIENVVNISTVKKASNLHTNISRDTYFVDRVDNHNDRINKDITKAERPLSRETYCMTTSEQNKSHFVNRVNDHNDTTNKDITKTEKPLNRETYCMTKSEHNKSHFVEHVNGHNETIGKDIIKAERPLSRETYCMTTSEQNKSHFVNRVNDHNDTIGKDIIKAERPLSRETYCMTTSEQNKSHFVEHVNDHNDTTNKDIIKAERPLSHETYCMTTSAQNKSHFVERVNDHNDIIGKDITKTERPLSRETYCMTTSENVKSLFVDRINDHNDTIDKDTTKATRPLSRENYCVTILETNKSKAREEDLLKDDMIKVTEDTTFMSTNTNAGIKNDVCITSKKVKDSFIKKIMGSMNQSIDSNNSLVQFERLELETKTVDSNRNRVTQEFPYIKFPLKEKRNYFDEDRLDMSSTVTNEIKAKEKKIYFDNIKVKDDQSVVESRSTSKEKASYSENIQPEPRKLINDGTLQHDNYRSPSLVKDVTNTDFEPNATKKLLGQAENMNTIKKIKNTFKAPYSIDLFEDSPVNSNKMNDILVLESSIKSIENFATSDKVNQNSDYVDLIPEVESKANKVQIKKESITKVHFTEEIKPSAAIKLDEQTKEEIQVEKVMTSDKEIENPKMKIVDSTANELKNKPILEYCTEILTNNEPLNCTKVNNTIEEFDNIYKDITQPRATEFDLLLTQEIKDSTIEENQQNSNEDSENDKLKYNLRNRLKVQRPKTERKRNKNKLIEGEILLESSAKCERKSRPLRKNLRLRRQDNCSEDHIEVENRLKDIVNLQTEFSDVTMDVPAPAKPPQDIPSPPKRDNDENSPIIGIQSCPAKSITRSRRKLFTPRAEPLDESSAETADSNERCTVLRPSYHRPRARRKL